MRCEISFLDRTAFAHMFGLNLQYGRLCIRLKGGVGQLCENSVFWTGFVTAPCAGGGGAITFGGSSRFGAGLILSRWVSGDDLKIVVFSRCHSSWLRQTCFNLYLGQLKCSAVHNKYTQINTATTRFNKRWQLSREVSLVSGQIWFLEVAKALFAARVCSSVSLFIILQRLSLPVTKAIVAIVDPSVREKSNKSGATVASYSWWLLSNNKIFRTRWEPI